MFQINYSSIRHLLFLQQQNHIRMYSKIPINNAMIHIYGVEDSNVVSLTNTTIVNTPIRYMKAQNPRIVKNTFHASWKSIHHSLHVGVLGVGPCSIGAPAKSITSSSPSTFIGTIFVFFIILFFHFNCLQIGQISADPSSHNFTAQLEHKFPSRQK